MIKETCICDICKKEPAKSYIFPFGTYVDAAGDVDEDYERYDLCDKHKSTMSIEDRRKKINFKKNKKFAEQIKLQIASNMFIKPLGIK